MNAREHADQEQRLMVIIPDRLSDIIAKGEVTDRYYNPGNLFREVHLVLINDDRPNRDELQRMVGEAELFLYSVGFPSFKKTLGWQPFLLKRWVESCISLTREISPDLIRVHNNFVQGYLARRIKETLGIPYVVSLHGVWDRDDLKTLKLRFIRLFRKKLEKASLKSADSVIAVYKPIMRYAVRYGAKRVELIYNIVSGHNLEKKERYEISNTPRLITINRQVVEKNPENIIRAVSEIDCEYTIIGDGPYHEFLKDLAARYRCEDKIEFIKAMPNDQLCALLKNFDIMVSHCDYWGISKTIIEGALVGLPIIINKHPIKQIEDYSGGWLCECENTPESYRSSIETLLRDEEKRSRFGRKAREHADTLFLPDAMELKTVQLYRSVLEQYR